MLLVQRLVVSALCPQGETDGNLYVGKNKYLVCNMMELGQPSPYAFSLSVKEKHFSILFLGVMIMKYFLKCFVVSLLFSRLEAHKDDELLDLKTETLRC